MKIYSKVSVLLLGVFLLFGVCNQMVMADKVAQVKLKKGKTYEYIFSTFDIGWSSTLLTQDSICIQNNLDYNDLNRVYWYSYTTNTCNWQDEWEFDVSFWDDSYPYLGFIPVTTESITGTLYGTSTTLTIPYSDIDYIQFYDKACAGTW